MAQQPPENSPDAVFKTTTKLVELSVIAQDKDGKPVADLRRDEFQIFDNGATQEIRVFLPEAAAPAPPPPPAPGTFTNALAAPGGAHGGYAVILIDNLQASFGDPNTQEEGAGLARLQALKMLRSMPMNQKIAIYATGRTLRVICEFTTDRDLLERELGKWKPRPDIPETATQPMKDALANHGIIRSDTYAAGIQRQMEEAERIDGIERAFSSDDQMEAVAAHLAGIPGRKNLIWISNRFSIGARAIQKFNRARVSLYPVDADGVCRICPPRPADAMDAIAAATGGLAYFKRNDLDIAMREAIDDGRVSYTLGFYQAGDDTKAVVHRLGVRVSRPGVNLRYRTSYQTEPRSASSGDPIAGIVQAMDQPVDATGIAVTASATRAGDQLDLHALFDVAGLGLELDQGLWKGQAELVVRFQTAEGVQAGDGIPQTVTFNLRPATYASMLTGGGIPYRRQMTIPAKAVELKLLIGNLASGKIGTLTIPLDRIKGAPANAK